VGWYLHSQINKPIILELGGAAPCFVSSSIDSNELQRVADWVCAGAFSFSGQACISTQNIFCSADRISEFRKKLSTSLDNFPCGSPASEDTLCGPVINSANYNRLESIRSSLAKNYKFLCQENSSKEKLFLSPHIFEQSRDLSAESLSEIFGPIRFLNEWNQSFSEWVEWANQQDHRLQAQVMSHNPTELKMASRNLQYGTVVANAPSLRFDTIPFGGQGLAGLGYEGTSLALDQMRYQKSVTIF
jgi:acyl-CoA reductase-like NAD-dependent aldehyde dehydrogenase